MIIDSNNIFLVSAEVEEHEYMCENTISNHQAIVIADDEKKARDKYANYWENKYDSQRRIYYNVRYITVTPAIS